MRCLYCDKHLGFFNKSKSAFCTEEHEELYRSAAQRRLETPYGPSAGVLENSALQKGQETGRVEDIAQLLKATQTASGSTVEAPTEVTQAADSIEAIVLVASSAEAISGRAVPETGSVSQVSRIDSPIDAPPAPHAIRADEASPPPGPSKPVDFPFPASSAGTDPQTDRRSQPRMNSVQIVKVSALRDPERELTCALVDTSDTGIQFTADADFAVGEILIAALPGQLLLAEVRHAEAKDQLFAIGAERVQTVSRGDALTEGSGAQRAELLIKALCDRVRTGFADDSAHGAGEESRDQRERALERVARILEIWQRVKSEPTPPTVAGESPAESGSEPAVNADQPAPSEPAPSLGTGRTLAAVASSLLIVALLMVCIVQYRKHQAAPPPPASKEIKSQQPEVKPLTAAVPAVQTPAPVQVKPAPPLEQHAAVVPQVVPQVVSKPAPKLAPAPQVAPAAAAAGLHRAQITAIQSTWVAVSTDGHKLFGKVIAKGATEQLEYSKFAFVHTGNAAGVEISVDGQPVPMGQQPRLRLVELNATGFLFLRWSNDDPSQP